MNCYEIMSLTKLGTRPNGFLRDDIATLKEESLLRSYDTRVDLDESPDWK